MKRRLVSFVLLIGVGLVMAPVIFQMFSRAPLGGEMLTEFEPFMTKTKVEQFQGYMAQIGEAHQESKAIPDLLKTDRAKFAARFPSTALFNEQWPKIFDDMNNGMLVTMEDMLDNFEAVNALPPFPLFPYFFVMPGLMIAGLAWSTLRADKAGAPTQTKLRLLVLMGIGLIAAPGIFQMFSRAPLGAEMINEFRPLMSQEKLSSVQGYFLTIGAAEGELRNQVEPKLGLSPAQVKTELPALSSLHRDWGNISNKMAPMIGAMADNIDNYQAIDALPPFTLFPWFFVVPGVMVIALSVAAGRGTPAMSGPKAFASGVPAPAAATQDFLQGLKQEAEARTNRSADEKEGN